MDRPLPAEKKSIPNYNLQRFRGTRKYLHNILPTQCCYTENVFFPFFCLLNCFGMLLPAKGFINIFINQLPHTAVAAPGGRIGPVRSAQLQPASRVARRSVLN